MALFSNLWGSDPYEEWSGDEACMRQVDVALVLDEVAPQMDLDPWEEGLCSWCSMGRRTWWSTLWPSLTSWQVERQQRCILVRSCFDLDLISVSEYHFFSFYHHKDLHPHPHHQYAQAKDGPEHSIVRIVMGRARWVKGTTTTTIEPTWKTLHTVRVRYSCCAESDWPQYRYKFAKSCAICSASEIFFILYIFELNTLEFTVKLFELRSID